MQSNDSSNEQFCNEDRKYVEPEDGLVAAIAATDAAAVALTKYGERLEFMVMNIGLLSGSIDDLQRAAIDRSTHLFPQRHWRWR